jgi:tetratricopeptide (TPR) repeat protein
VSHRPGVIVRGQPDRPRRADRAVGNRSGEAHAYNILGVCLVEAGRFDEGIVLNRQAVAIAEETDNAVELSRAYNNLVCVLAAAARLEEPADVTLDSLSKGEKLGGIRLQTAALNSIDALMQLGRWDEAGRLLEEIGDRRGGASCSETSIVMCRATLYLRAGRFAEAADALERVDELTADL